MTTPKSTMILLTGLCDIDHEIIASAMQELKNGGFPNPTESDAIKYMIHTWIPQVKYVVQISSASTDKPIATVSDSTDKSIMEMQK